jgi:hypothetical protein
MLRGTLRVELFVNNPSDSCLAGGGAVDDGVRFTLSSLRTTVDGNRREIDEILHVGETNCGLRRRFVGYYYRPEGDGWFRLAFDANQSDQCDLIEYVMRVYHVSAGDETPPITAPPTAPDPPNYDKQPLQLAHNGLDITRSVAQGYNHWTYGYVNGSRLMFVPFVNTSWQSSGASQTELARCWSGACPSQPSLSAPVEICSGIVFRPGKPEHAALAYNATEVANGFCCKKPVTYEPQL